MVNYNFFARHGEDAHIINLLYHFHEEVHMAPRLKRFGSLVAAYLGWGGTSHQRGLDR
jgi:hypothetical protein